MNPKDKKVKWSKMVDNGYFWPFAARHFGEFRAI